MITEFLDLMRQNACIAWLKVNRVAFPDALADWSTDELEDWVLGECHADESDVKQLEKQEMKKFGELIRARQRYPSVSMEYVYVNSTPRTN